MATTIYLAKNAKRRNSTSQFTLSSAQQLSCALKTATSVDRPIFTIYSATFPDYNVAYWNGLYYFITDITSVKENIWDVSCVVDALASYKSDIIAGTYFVSYASDSTLANPFIIDTRLPESKEVFIASDIGTPTMRGGVDNYILTVNTRSGIKQYCLTESDFEALCSNLQTWLKNQVNSLNTEDVNGNAYTWSTILSGTDIENLGKMINQNTFFGNAYSDAPNQIKSCYVTKLKPSLSANAEQIYLGQYPTGISAKVVTDPKVLETINVDLNWDLVNVWERCVHANAIIKLPYVGVVDLPADAIANYNQITVLMAFSVLDGTVGYSLRAHDSTPGSTLTDFQLGDYTGSCASYIAVGMSQAPSAAAVMQTAFSGITSTVSAGIGTLASGLAGNVIGVVGGAAQTAVNGISAAIDVKNAQATYNNVTIGNFSGCVGDSLGPDIRVQIIQRPLTSSQAIVADTLGYPVQRNLNLSGISGYVQCANAHANVAATAEELDAIDQMLNSGFYIE